MTPDWGCHCAEWALAQAGVPSPIGPWPRNWRAAAELYRRYDVRSLGDLTAKFFQEVPVLQAKRGDLVMVAGALGVCRGEWAEFMDAMQPMKKAMRAWAVQHG